MNINVQEKRGTNQLSHRERFRKYADEIKYGLSLVVQRLTALQRARSPSDESHTVKLFVALSTQKRERGIFAHSLRIHHLEWINIVSGRDWSQDLLPPQNRAVVTLVDTQNWESHVTELGSLLSHYCILLDGWYYANAVAGQHAARSRHSRLTETELRNTLNAVVTQYGSKQNGGL